MKHFKFIFISMVSGLFLIFAGIYFYKDTASLQVVKIGIVLPLTGDFKIYGQRGLQGVRMAVQDINENGGVLGGRPLDIVIRDNKTDPGLSVQLTRELVEKENVIALVGPVSSSARNAMTEVAEELKTPLLYGIDYEGGIYNRYLFCYSSIPDHYVKPLIPYLMQHHGKSFYIFGYDYVWPHKISDAVQKEVTSQGGHIAGIEFTPFGRKSFKDSIDRIKDSGANVLILILPGTDGFTFIKEFSVSGQKNHIKLAAMAAEESYLTALTAYEREGIITPLHFIESLQKKEARSFVARQKEMFGQDTIVTFASEAHYGLIQLLKNAINIVGTLDKEKIIDAMEGLEITVGNGLVKMRKDHNMNLNMIIAEFKGNQLVARKEIGLISPSDQRQEIDNNQ